MDTPDAEARIMSADSEQVGVAADAAEFLAPLSTFYRLVGTGLSAAAATRWQHLSASDEDRSLAEW